GSRGDASIGLASSLGSREVDYLGARLPTLAESDSPARTVSPTVGEEETPLPASVGAGSSGKSLPALERTSSAESLVFLTPQRLAKCCQLSSRFRDTKLEELFVHHRNERFDLSLCACVVVCILAQLASLAVAQFRWTDADPHARFFQLVVESLSLSVFFGILLLLFVFRAKRWRREGLSTFLYIFVTISVQLQSGAFMAFASGTDASSCGTDGPCIIVLLALVTSAFYGLLSIPCRQSWPLIAFIPCTYVLLLLPKTGSGRASLGQNLLVAGLLAVHSLVSFLAQAKSELFERRHFASQRTEPELKLTKGVSPRIRKDGVGSNIMNANFRSDALDVMSDGSGSAGYSSMAFYGASHLHGLNLGDNTAQHVLTAIAAIGMDEKWLVKSSHLELFPSCVLGQGAFATVVGGRLHGAPVAVKVPLSLQVPGRCSALASELRILRSIRHPGIVSFLGACIDPAAGEILLIEELVVGATLTHFIRCPPLSPDSQVRRRLLLGICSALRYLHRLEPAVVHGDLKPANILIDEATLQPKLVDFGLSRRVVKDGLNLGGTPHWMAPEVLIAARETTAAAADAYSLGCVAFFVITGLKPRASLSKDELVRLSKEQKLPDLEWPLQDSEYQAECKELCKRCMRTSPLQRPDLLVLHDHVLTWHSGQAPVCTVRTLLEIPITANQSLDEENAVRQAVLSEIRSAGLTRSRLSSKSLSSFNFGVHNPSALLTVSCSSRSFLLGEALTPRDIMGRILNTASAWNINDARAQCCQLHSSLSHVPPALAGLRLLSCKDLVGLQSEQLSRSLGSERPWSRLGAMSSGYTSLGSDPPMSPLGGTPFSQLSMPVTIEPMRRLQNSRKSSSDSPMSPLGGTPVSQFSMPVTSDQRRLQNSGKSSL
ncbi:unnamed protein product, partial [Polarella glacialis]